MSSTEPPARPDVTPSAPQPVGGPSPVPAGPADLPAALDPAAYDPDTDLVAVRREGHVVVVELADPGRRNAMGPEMTAAWGRLMATLRRDTQVRAVLVTGRGSAFSSGGNTSWIGADSHLPVSLLRERMLAYYRTWLSIRDLDVPTIAAVNGPAVGAGAALALACDIRWAARSAAMSLPFVRMGLHPGMLSTFLTTEVGGVAVARDLLLTGRRVGASELLALGLVSRVVGDVELPLEAREGARALAAGAPLAVRLTKAALRDGGPRDASAALQWEGLAQAVTLTSEDLGEGLRALRERREPSFRGS